MDVYMELTIIFGILCLIFSYLLWRARSMMKLVFGSMKNWFLSGRGYGLALLTEPHKNIKVIFTKLNEPKISHSGKTYVNMPGRIYRILGIACTLYNINDSEPIDIIGNDQSVKDIKRSAAFWDSMAVQIKAFEEARAQARMQSFIMLIWITLGLSVVACSLSGYAVYLLMELKKAGAIKAI